MSAGNTLTDPKNGGMGDDHVSEGDNVGESGEQNPTDLTALITSMKNNIDTQLENLSKVLNDRKTGVLPTLKTLTQKVNTDSTAFAKSLNSVQEKVSEKFRRNS